MPADRRPRAVIAVAENAIDVLNAAFVSPDGQRIWVAPTVGGTFDPVPALPPGKARAARRPVHLSHGTQVATVLAAYSPVPGVLQHAALTWFDLLDTSPDDSNKRLFTLLAGRGAVINFSQKLESEDAWRWLRDGVRAAPDRILLVAAAPNIGELTEGPPLTWKTVAPLNILGIGVANNDPNKSIPDNAPYLREFIDLLAPGSAVPVFDHEGTLGCIDGTSFATAYATAAIAILTQHMSLSSVPEIRARLFATAQWRDAYGQRVKAGHIDIARALESLDDNVLTLDRGQGQPRKLAVEFTERASLQFIGTTTVDGGRDQTIDKTIRWSDVLRLERRTDTGQPPVYRLSALVDGRYTIYRDVSIPQDAVIGLHECRDSETPNLDCRDMRVVMLKDYVARALGPNRVVGF